MRNNRAAVLSSFLWAAALIGTPCAAGDPPWTHEPDDPGRDAGPARMNLPQLQGQFNYTSSPGRHSALSPVPGTRAAELDAVNGVMGEPGFAAFAKAIYNKNFTHLIPADRLQEAEALARELFESDLGRYKDAGLTRDNAVTWVDTEGMRGAASDKTWVHDVENAWNTWNVQAAVEDTASVVDGKALPVHLVARHEFRHLEETMKGLRASKQGSPGGEVVSTLQTIMDADAIYKKLHGLGLDEVVDYGKSVEWGGRKVPLGELVNFYRGLKEKHGSLAKAVVSEESRKFIKPKKDEQPRKRSQEQEEKGPGDGPKDGGRQPETSQASK